jgi:hypothetical protein
MVYCIFYYIFFYFKKLCSSSFPVLLSRSNKKHQASKPTLTHFLSSISLTNKQNHSVNHFLFTLTLYFPFFLLLSIFPPLSLLPNNTLTLYNTNLTYLYLSLLLLSSLHTVFDRSNQNIIYIFMS